MRPIALCLTALCLLGCPRHDDTGGGGGPARLPVASVPDAERYHAMVARAAASTSLLTDALERNNPNGALRALTAARTNLYEAERYVAPGDQAALIEAENQGVKVQAYLADGAVARAAAQELMHQLSAIQEGYRGPAPRPTAAVPARPAPQVAPVRPLPAPPQHHHVAPHIHVIPAPAPTRRWSGMVPQPQFDPR